MRKGTLITVVAAGLVMSLLAGPAAAVDRVYTNGSVWNVTYVRTEPGQFDAYMANLAGLYKPILDAQIEKGWVKSYKILAAQPGNRKDWDLMLLIESPNWAVFDVPPEEADAVVESIAGESFDQDQATVDRRKLREIIGSKNAQELLFK